MPAGRRWPRHGGAPNGAKKKLFQQEDLFGFAAGPFMGAWFYEKSPMNRAAANALGVSAASPFTATAVSNGGRWFAGSGGRRRDLR